jgi:hypothetical protein
MNFKRNLTEFLKTLSTWYAFHAVVGYFRTSGYYTVRKRLLKLVDVKILVGINLDHMIAEAKRRGLVFMGDPKRTREEFIKWMQTDIKEARYSKKVEEGILLFMEDIMDGKIKIRAHKSHMCFRNNSCFCLINSPSSLC